MVELNPIVYDDGTDSLTNFLEELMDKHHNEEEKYITPLLKVIEDFRKKGPLINLDYSKKFPPFKKMSDIHKDLAELRTYECRYFIYKTGVNEWLGLHGYEKKSQDTPKNQIKKVKGEIKQWEQRRKKK